MRRTFFYDIKENRYTILHYLNYLSANATSKSFY